MASNSSPASLGDSLDTDRLLSFSTLATRTG
jgi:hypothetical protein